MRTDTIFFQLFQTFDGLLFELVGLPPETAAGYRFTSVEIKEKAFRFDGIFIPEALDKNIWFVEVQFQKRAEFYWEFIGEIFLYLSQYKPSQFLQNGVLSLKYQSSSGRYLLVGILCGYISMSCQRMSR